MNTTKHTTFKFRLSVELMDWLKDYAKRTGQPMAIIIKQPLESLRKEDLSRPKLGQRGGKSD